MFYHSLLFLKRILCFYIFISGRQTFNSSKLVFGWEQEWRRWLQREGHASLRAGSSRGYALVRTTVAMSAKRRASTAAIAEASAAAASAQSTVLNETIFYLKSLMSITQNRTFFFSFWFVAFKNNKSGHLSPLVAF